MNNNLFWYYNPEILFSKENLIDFIPTNDITKSENLNSILRLSIYISIIMFISRKNILVFFIPILTAIITIYLHHWSMVKTKIEKVSILSDDSELEKKLYPNDCQVPTEEDILMNTKVSDLNNPNSNKKPACQLTDEIIKKQDELLTKSVYRDVNDIYGKNNSQRQFFTMPDTSKEFGISAGNTELLAKWLYSTGPTCKEDTMRCTNSRSLINEDLRRKRGIIF